jgi:glycogen debranching enzyme
VEQWGVHRREEVPLDDGLASDIVTIEDRYYILATSGLTDEANRVLMRGDTFGVFDRFGDIKPVGLGEEGIYHEGTRYLSALLLRLGAERPMMLGSNVRLDNALLAVDVTNPDIFDGDELRIPRGTLHLARTMFLWNGALHERLRLRNFGQEQITVPLTLRFAADHADVFEVRGARREQRGERLEPRHNRTSVLLGYRGLDDRVRRTRLDFHVMPRGLSPSIARYEVELEPLGEELLTFAVTCDADEDLDAVRPPGDPQAASHALAQQRERGCEVKTSNAQFNGWIDRSVADLAMLTTPTRHGAYPYAGIPWYSTPFGRDGLITGLQTLWCNPEISRGVLAFLAATQAETEDPERDAEPGKILHEMRSGEMAALGEIPFGCYYGSHDATPLFVLLAAAHYRRTADVEFARELWPHVERALAWMDDYGDPDADGFLEYRRATPRGIAQQGWKDSIDSVFYADGRLVEGPVALCEIQGYAYAARLGAAEMAEAVGHSERSAPLRGQAEALRLRFEEAFWVEELGTYAIALDGDKQPCAVRTSNAGQVLMSGIASRDRAARVAGTLLSAEGYSGWGVRTVAFGQARYNPMSYHDGSIWPHDNAMVALGLARYGMPDAALRILESLFAASQFFELHRLPELYCGFYRREGEGPTAYPVACSPQAWSAACVFMMLQACLGLEVDAVRRQVRFSNPRLPHYVEEAWISGLQVGEATIDLALRGHVDDVAITVLRRRGEVQVVDVK